MNNERDDFVQSCAGLSPSLLLTLWGRASRYLQTSFDR